MPKHYDNLDALETSIKTDIAALTNGLLKTIEECEDYNDLYRVLFELVKLLADEKIISSRAAYPFLTLFRGLGKVSLDTPLEMPHWTRAKKELLDFVFDDGTDSLQRLHGIAVEVAEKLNGVRHDA